MRKRARESTKQRRSTGQDGPAEQGIEVQLAGTWEDGQTETGIRGPKAWRWDQPCDGRDLDTGFVVFLSGFIYFSFGLCVLWYNVLFCWCGVSRVG